MIGELLNQRYRIDAEIGQGGMGDVYRAFDTVIQREVAIKIISSKVIDSEAKARILREAQTAGQLNHPNIVAIHDVGEVDGSPFIVMEFVVGKTLWDIDGLSLGESLKLLIQVCAALENAHSNGIIHRDLKPENIMITESQSVKLMDFGLARSGGDSRLTRQGEFVGTLSYMAPEVILGKEATAQSDLYALGIIIYELLTDRLLFSADDPLAVLSQHIHAPVVPPSNYNSEIPSVIEELTLQLLEKEPEARPRSAGDVSDILEAIQTPPQTSSAVFQDTSSISRHHSGQLALLDRMVRGRLIGREKELTELVSFWERAAGGEGHLVLLSGEPGVGKTRLSRELSVYAGLQGANVLVGQFQPEIDVTYLAIREAIRNFLRSQPLEEMGELIGSSAAEMIKILPEVGEIVGDIIPNPKIDGLEEERWRMFDHLTQFLLKIATKAPLMLVLEDLHWADSASLQFLHYLLRNTRHAPILVLGTYREVSLDPARPFYEKLLGLNRERLYTRLALRRLDSMSTRKLVNVLLDNPLDSDLVDQIYQETTGNPFFIEEVIKSLMGRNILRLKDDTWVLVDNTDLHVPQSIQIAVGKRIANLSENSQAALKHASILGQTFDLDVLIEMTGQDEDHVLDALEEAEKALLIRESGRKGQDDYHFEHALISQVLVEGTSMRRRARLHQLAGEAMEKVFASNLDPIVEKLAHHFSLAPLRVAEKAINYGLQAAENSVAVYAHEQAILNYTRVLEVLEELNDPVREAQLWELLADTKAKLNYPQERIEAYENALAALEKAEATNTLHYFQISHKLANSLEAYDPTRARQLIKNALSNPLVQSDKSLQAKCMSDEVYYLSSDGALDQALELGQQSLALAGDSGDQKAIARAWGALKQVYKASDDLTAYADAVEHEISALDQCNDYFGVFDVFFDGIHAYYSQGDIKAAERLATSGLTFCRVTNAPGWEGTILANYLWILYLQGRWSEALDHAARVLPLFQQVGRSTCFAYIFLDLAFIESGLGHLEQAEEHVDSMLNLLLQFESITTESDNFLVFQFLGYVAKGFWQDAWEVVEKANARDFHPRSATPGSHFTWTIYVTEVAARVGRFAEAESMSREILSYFEQIQVPVGKAAAHFGLGLSLAGQRKWNKALSYFELALADFRILNQPFDIANTLFEIGLVYIHRGDGKDPEVAGQYLEEALMIYEQIEASPSTKKTQDLLSTLPMALSGDHQVGQVSSS